MMRLLSKLLVFVLLIPGVTSAQATLLSDEITIQKARVLQVTESSNEFIAGTDTRTLSQNVRAEILDGTDAGKIVGFTNDYTQLEIGDVFYLRHAQNDFDGTDAYSVADPYRLNVLALLLVTFLILVGIFGGVQGLRGIASLVGSIVLIVLVLIPGIAQGYPPIPVSIAVAGLIIVAGSYITHGFTRTTSAAVIGMLVTVLLTGLLAFWAVHASHLSGFSSDESVYLNFSTDGGIDLVGLLFGGIMIGLLGVLYDLAIGQAIAVEELLRAGIKDRALAFRRGIRIGREHIGALVNTLAIAYVGASLPLLLLMQNTTFGVPFLINSEVIATEAVRILIGSIGLILTVPITTFIASRMLTGDSSAIEHHHVH